MSAAAYRMDPGMRSELLPVKWTVKYNKDFSHFR